MKLKAPFFVLALMLVSGGFAAGWLFGGGPAMPTESKAAPTEGRRFDADVDFRGRWRNGRGSEMVLEQDGAALSGWYLTQVGASADDRATRFPLKGYAHGDQVVFSVDFFPYSMTTWAGQILTEGDGRKSLKTLWLNTQNAEEAKEPEEGWKALTSGADEFVRVP